MARHHGGGPQATVHTTATRETQNTRTVDPADNRRAPTPPQRAAGNTGEARIQISESDTGRTRHAAGTTEQSEEQAGLLDEAAGGTPLVDDTPPSYRDSQISAAAAGSPGRHLRQFGLNLFRE